MTKMTKLTRKPKEPPAVDPAVDEAPVTVPPTAKPKRKPGRPSVLTPEREDKLFRLVSTGSTYREACRALKISPDAVNDRKAADHAFYLRSARATLMGVEANLALCEERLRSSTNKRISVDRELAHHFRWKASKLLAAYKEKVGLDVLTEVRFGPQPEEMSVIEVARRVAFVLAEGRRLAPGPAALGLTHRESESRSEVLDLHGDVIERRPSPPDNVPTEPSWRPSPPDNVPPAPKWLHPYGLQESKEDFDARQRRGEAAMSDAIWAQKQPWQRRGR